jgi:ParB-like chromosome segregation protein Spo0J
MQNKKGKMKTPTTEDNAETSALEARHKIYPQLIEVDPMKIKFNERNPRKHGGTEYLRLKESVKEVGVVQKPTVRVLAGGFYECVDGEGRVRAAQEAGLAKIWVVSLGILSDTDALLMLQAANSVREFNYLAACQGLANLHRQGQSRESIARSVGANGSSIQTDIAVGYFPERTLALVQNDLLLQSSKEDSGKECSEEGLEKKRTISWSAHTFSSLLPLRIQLERYA